MSYHIKKVTKGSRYAIMLAVSFVLAYFGVGMVEQYATTTDGHSPVPGTESVHADGPGDDTDSDNVGDGDGADDAGGDSCDAGDAGDCDAA